MHNTHEDAQTRRHTPAYYASTGHLSATDLLIVGEASTEVLLGLIRLRPVARRARFASDPDFAHVTLRHGVHRLIQIPGGGRGKGRRSNSEGGNTAKEWSAETQFACVCVLVGEIRRQTGGEEPEDGVFN